MRKYKIQNILRIEVENLRNSFGVGASVVFVCRLCYTNFTFNSPKYQYFWHLQLSRKLWKNVIVCCLQTLLLTDFTRTLAEIQVVRNTQRGNVIMFVLIYLHKIKFYGFMVMTNIYLSATLDLTSLLFSQILHVRQLQFGMLILS